MYHLLLGMNVMPRQAEKEGKQKIKEEYERENIYKGDILRAKK